MSIGIGGLVGAVLGFFATRSLFGAFIGYFIGSSFDRFNSNKSNSSNSYNFRSGSYSNDANYYSSRLNQNDFATALLILSGAVMKADGKILKSELDYVKDFFKQQFSVQLASKYISDFKDILSKEGNAPMHLAAHHAAAPAAPDHWAPSDSLSAHLVVPRFHA